MSEQVIPVREEERFDAAAVAQYLREHLPGFPGGPLEVRQFAAGKSNLTYLLTAGAWQAVLRRPPLGPVAPRAHDMERESKILSLLHPVFPLAPKPYVFCGDTGVIGAPFYVMEVRRGVVFDTDWPLPAPPTPDLCRRIAENMVETLVTLHAVDWETAGLAAIGYPQGYLERQVTGWIKRWEAARTAEVPEVAPLTRWLVQHMPPSPPPTLIHNDFKLNNMIMAADDPARPVAVVDWEMATVGDPLTDVGNLVIYWSEPEDRALFGDMAAVTALPEFPRRRDVVEMYAQKSGRDLSGIRYYLALAYFRLAGIVQQIYYRYWRGQTRDPRFAPLGDFARHYVRRGLQYATEGHRV